MIKIKIFTLCNLIPNIYVHPYLVLLQYIGNIGNVADTTEIVKVLESI